ncbi:alanine racemase [Oscillochloris sp. ZM17-4]|uniref:alanine racemase n=1 Tax=Oscillochloris sp. ZM17-4 TaxID=2866714 RepID=UPI001C72A1B4|nr:alanine racemase [Oscillochloris sp. ZM17-4]MBX0326559.1 alanine racemase [Oscillochloris sp. ZM17-4]
MNLAIPLGEYAIADSGDLLTPTLLIYQEAVDANIATTIRLLDGRPDRWRPHVKTAKLAWVMQRMLDHGIRQFKCATTRELETLCALGAPDVLLAYPVVGANTRRVAALAAAYPGTRVSALVEGPAQIAQWRGAPVSLFIDINPGMDRTGVGADVGAVLALARGIGDAGLPFAGLHWYDGQIGSVPPEERESVAHSGYDRLLKIAAGLGRSGAPAPELITSGTPAMPHALTHAGLADAGIPHRISPGTPVYGDTTSLSQLPAAWGYRPAALVLAAVVSRPRPRRITCDAGSKSVGADAGVPTCAVVGHPDWEPARPSEEHLPINLPAGAEPPPIGAQLYLLPRHICPTINNFDAAAIVSGGRALRLEPVTARGHEPGTV